MEDGHAHVHVASGCDGLSLTGTRVRWQVVFLVTLTWRSRALGRKRGHMHFSPALRAELLESSGQPWPLGNSHPRVGAEK